VAGLRNSCAAISGLDAPLPARRAISPSCAVRASCGSARLRADPLALAEGDPEQAALLAAAAAGLQRRVGLRAWPMLREGEAELTGQIRQAQDPDRFTKMTEAGSRLSQQEAMAAIRHHHGTGTASPDTSTKPDQATGPTATG
jgi:hypothetical protein